MKMPGALNQRALIILDVVEGLVLTSMKQIDPIRIMSIESGPDKTILANSGFIDLFDRLEIPSEIELIRIIDEARMNILANRENRMETLGTASTRFIPIFHTIYSRLPRETPERAHIANSARLFHADWVAAGIDLIDIGHEIEEYRSRGVSRPFIVRSLILAQLVSDIAKGYFDHLEMVRSSAMDADVLDNRNSLLLALDDLEISRQQLVEIATSFLRVPDDENRMREQLPVIGAVSKTFGEIIVHFQKMMQSPVFELSRRVFDLMADEWDLITREARALCRENNIPLVDLLQGGPDTS